MQHSMFSTCALKVPLHQIRLGYGGIDLGEYITIADGK
jgi:hypothetical protein